MKSLKRLRKTSTPFSIFVRYGLALASELRNIDYVTPLCACKPEARFVNNPSLVARHASAPSPNTSLAHPWSRPRPHPLVVRPVHLPLATPDRHWIDAFPFAVKPLCPSHPNPSASNIAQSQWLTSKAQDTAALRSTRRASPLEVWTSSLFRRISAGYGFA